LYDKTTRLPPDGSLRDALFQTVWLKRAEAEIHKAKLMYAGFAEMIAASGGTAKGTYESFRGFLEATLPFAKKARGQMDAEMVERLKKETQSGGYISFTPATMPNPLRARAKEMKIPDEIMSRIAKRRLK
jgi:hypothetical protein